MNGVLFATLCLTVFFTQSAITLDTVREILSPRNPKLTRVRNLEESPTAGFSKAPGIPDFIALVEWYGYPAEEHDVTTEDGYHLKLHRILSRSNSSVNENKPVVLMQHGLLATSDCWVLFGPEKDLAFLLVDAGYDVWLGNIRGNSYCRSHENLSTSDPEFWRFSYHEHGIYDTPAMIDYILDYTRKGNLQYIGYSQGTTSLFALLSTRLEYNEKISFAVCLAPIAFWKHTLPPIQQFVCSTFYHLREVLEINGMYNMLPQTDTYVKLVQDVCADGSPIQVLCMLGLDAFPGYDARQIKTALLPYILSYFACGTSIQALAHFAQNVITGNFEAYDYGAEGNLERYKQALPPAYELEKITVPLALYYAKRDGYTREQDMQETIKHLLSTAVKKVISYPYFTHLDFLWAKDARELLYDDVVELMEEFRD